MANKRKREELSDSDSDEVTPGKQILPVANLPYNFDQEPQDGMQYLFLVRRDARRLPHVTRVRNPYEVPEAKFAYASTPSFSNVLPCEEWRAAFQTHFSNLRQNLTQVVNYADHDYSCSRQRPMPEKKDRDAWWKYLAGHPESAWSVRNRSTEKKQGISTRMRASEAVFHGDVTGLHEIQSRPAPCHDLPRNVPPHPQVLDFLGSAEPPNTITDTSKPEEHMERLSPPEVTPGHLREIDHRTSIHLLMYFTHWINVHLQNPSDPMTTISVIHAQWIFALLTKVSDQLSADEMNLVRNLARACIGLIQKYKDEQTNSDTVNSQRVLAKDTIRMSDASCWIIFAAIAGYWGQRDLWADAETKLAGDIGNVPVVG